MLQQRCSLAYYKLDEEGITVDGEGTDERKKLLRRHKLPSSESLPTVKALGAVDKRETVL